MSHVRRGRQNIMDNFPGRDFRPPSRVSGAAGREEASPCLMRAFRRHSSTETCSNAADSDEMQSGSLPSRNLGYTSHSEYAERASIKRLPRMLNGIQLPAAIKLPKGLRTSCHLLFF